MNIGIVGGGKASVAIMQAFSGLQEYRISLLCDLDPKSPGMVYARENGIGTTTEMKDLLGSGRVNLLIELTGNPKVRDLITAGMSDRQSLIPAHTARLLYEVVEANNNVTRDLTHSFLVRVDEIHENMQAAFRPIGKSEDNIVRLLREAHMLNTNAKIQAARAGQAGAAFSTVVDRLEELTRDIQESLDLISSAAGRIESGVSTLALTREDMEAKLERH